MSYGATQVKLIVGLGNPGKEYTSTRHNIGYMAIDSLAENADIQMTKSAFKAISGTGFLDGIKVILFKPQTYMNLSGEAVRAVSAYYKIPASDIIVVHDDMDIAFGHIRIKKHGGSAGHRGIESIIKCLNDNRFLRIRAGIGKPPDNLSPSQYVLQKFGTQEKNTLKGVISNIQECIRTILKHGPEKAMNIYHCTNREIPKEPVND